VRTILAPAKVNLVLEVGNRRSDGFHELATVFQSIALSDRITIEEASTDIDLQVTGPQAMAGHLTGGQANLVWRAARLFAQGIGKKQAGVRIVLEKHIPVAAGLGGGSSDAAATLRGLADLWHIDDPEFVFNLATQLGSDVAFFLQAGAALGRGRGEVITPLELPPVWLALANPGLPTSTAEVYRELAASRATGQAKLQALENLGARCTQLITAMRNRDFTATGQCLRNDLAAAAVTVTPAIEPLLKTLRTAGALGAEVSGSGSTVFALAADATQAEELAQCVKATAAWTWWGCSTPGGGETIEQSSYTNQTG
jgi:4-diphosphocytidyl-2-C-methyl-D-erythritol kinase